MVSSASEPDIEVHFKETDKLKLTLFRKMTEEEELKIEEKRS
jgi:hypothetical protein